MATYSGNKDLMLGNDYLLYLYTGSTTGTEVPIAYSTSCSIQVDAETIEANSKFACRWKNNLAGNCSYTVSSDALYTQTTGLCSFDSLMEAMVAGKTIKWALGKRKGGDCTASTSYDIDTVDYSGEAVITSLSLDASVDEVASCSISLEGSGELSTPTPDVTLHDFGEE